MPYVIDLTGEEYPLKATITNDGEVNGNQIISATIEFNSINKAFIHNIGELWRIVDHDDVEHVIKYCRRRGVGDKMAVDIKGVPVFFDKLDNDRIYERIDKHMTANEVFSRIFENTGFTFVLVDSFAAVDWEGFGDGETKLESFKRAIERYKCEFEIIGNTVYLRSQIGRDTSIMYRHKLNASNIVQEIDANELWTFARGYGDYGDGEGGDDWRDAKLIREYTSPLASILGIRHAPPIKNGNIKDPAFMDAQLKTLVDESLKISVSATIHDLRKQGYPYAQSQLGDRVFLIDERIGLNEEVRVVAQSITRDWKGNVIDINITFGSHSIVKRHQSNLQTAIKNISDLIEGRKKLPFNVLDNAVMEATRALTRMQSQLQIAENGSLLAVDKTNPNNLVILNAAGLGVSKDGGQTFGQAITGLGINASYIYSGHINSNTVTIGNNKIHIDSEGLHVYKNGIEGASLVEGNLTFNDQTNGQQIGMFAATSWEQTGALGISMNIEQNRFVTFGRYEGADLGYISMLVLNPGAIPGLPTGIINNLPIRANEDIWLGNRALRLGENNTHNHSAIWHGADDSAIFASYTGIRLGYLTSGGTVNNRLTVDENSVDIWQDLDMHGWKILNAGDIYSNGVAVTSDINKKKNITDYTKSVLDEIKTMQPKQYHLLDDDDNELKRLGVILQEAPADVVDPRGAIDSYAYSTFILKGLQESVQIIEEQSQTIETQKQEIDALKTQMAAVLERLDALETQNDEPSA